MKSSLLALPILLLTFFSTTPLCLTAGAVSEQVVTRENYCEYLDSVANTKDSCGHYAANIAAEGIIQTPTADGNLCYVIANGIDPEAAIHGLTRVQQKGYCDWIDDQKENKDTLCSLKNEVESNIPAEDQETVIVISSSEKGTSPLMMFQESEKKQQNANAVQEARSTADRTCEATDPSSLQQRGTQAATIKEPDDSSITSDLTNSDDTSTRLSSYHQSPTQLITAARQQAFAATQELLALQSHQHEIEALSNSYRDIQKALSSAYRLRRHLKKSNTEQLQAYQKIVHGICLHAELAYDEAQQKLRNFSQLPGCTPAANTFIEKAYANFSETQEKLHTLKQQHQQGLSADADAVSSAFAQAYEKSKHPSEISTPPPSKPTAEEQEALRLEQFLKEHQWYGIAKSGKKVPLGMNRSEEEHEVHIALQEERPQPPLPSIPPPTVLQSFSSADETRAVVEHVVLKKEEDVGTEIQKSVTPSKIKSKQKKVATEAPRAKSEAEWKAEIEANFPLSSFKLETVDFDLFQTSAAALLHCLVDDPNYADLFEGLAEEVREGIRNIEKWDYRFGINDAPTIRALKKFVQKKINETHYPTYLAKQIALAKSRTEEQERLSKLSTEAEQRLLAELEGETKTTQKASATKKSKSKK